MKFEQNNQSADKRYLVVSTTKCLTLVAGHKPTQLECPKEIFFFKDNSYKALFLSLALNSLRSTTCIKIVVFCWGFFFSFLSSSYGSENKDFLIGKYRSFPVKKTTDKRDAPLSLNNNP